MRCASEGYLFMALTSNLRRLLQILGRSVAATGMLACLSGCGAISGVTEQAAQLRIVDASPEAIVDVYSGSAALAYHVGFGTVTTYVPMTPASYAFPVNRSNSRVTLSSLRAGLSTGEQYTLLIGSRNGVMQSKILLDQAQPAPAGHVSLRFLNEATSSEPLALYLVPPGQSLSRATPVQAGLVQGGNTGYQNLPAGTYTLHVAEQGANSAPLYSGPSTTYASGSVHTIVLIDQRTEAWPSLQAITTNDSSTLTMAKD